MGNEPPSIPSIAEALTFLRTMSLYDTVEEPLLREMAQDLIWTELPAGVTLFKQDDVPEWMFIIKTGTIQSFINHPVHGEQIVDEVGPGNLVGEIELLANEPRSTTARTVTPVTGWKLPDSSFDRLNAKSSLVMDAMRGRVEQQLKHNHLGFILPKLFGPLSLEQMRTIEGLAERCSLSAGEALFYQGDPADYCYVLVTGRLKAVKLNERCDEQLLAEINPGQSVGETQMFTGRDRYATVYALRDSELLQFSKSVFDAMMIKNPVFGMRIARDVIDRFEKGSRGELTETTLGSNIAIIPAGPHAPVREFAEKLAACLKEIRTTVSLSAESVNAALHVPGIAQATREDPYYVKLLAWFDEQDRKHEIMLFTCQPTMTQWTRFCLRMADHVLIVGNESDDPMPGYLEKELLYSGRGRQDVRRSLVLIHPNGDHPPLRTARWLDPRTLDMHHHIRWDHPDDFARLARFVARCPVGVVLGSGGTRGFAHLGVLQALVESGIPIDFVGGSSIGSIIAAQYARGWDYNALEKEIDHLVDLFKIFDYTIPFIALITGRKAYRNLRSFFGNLQLEDLWMPCFIVSANLSRATVMVHKQGALVEAIRASIAIPGVFPPFVHHGDLLVDGGLLNDMPVDVMHKLCDGGTIIASDVSNMNELAENNPYGNFLSGWRIVWGKLNPFAERVELPNIFRLLYRTTELGSVHMKKSMVQTGFIDLHIKPDVSRFDLFDKRFAEIVKAGYDATILALSKWTNRPKFGSKG